ncbi:MAG: hypothetical protein Q4C48_08675 [Lachnospiraceae bacterium]|nr:hypothetical protein [Lachnospiraceae bacterium]
MAKKKLLWKIPLFVIIGAVVVHLVIWLYVHWMANRPTVSSVLPGHTDYMQMAYGYVHCMELAEKSGIAIDPAVREEVRDFVVALRECYEEGRYDGVSCSEIIKVGYLYSYFDLDCTGLQKALDEFYIKKERLFAEDSADDPSQMEADVSGSADFLKILFDTGSELLEDYKVRQGLETWFNENIAEEIGKKDAKLGMFHDILYIFYTDGGSVETLSYSYLREDALSFLQEVDREMDSYETSIWNVGILDDAVFEADIFDYDRDFLTASRQMYEKLDSREAFGYDVNEGFGLLVISYFLREHFSVTGSIYNDFLAENLNGMLHEHFERYCKGRIGT